VMRNARCRFPNPKGFCRMLAMPSEQKWLEGGSWKRLWERLLAFTYLVESAAHPFDPQPLPNPHPRPANFQLS